ncbi:FAD binding domain-containing protein [Candidatus Bipolaricaulota bacterium]
MTNVREYQRPSSIEEAWSLLSESGKNAMLVGGGVDVALFIPPEVETLIDLALIPHQSIELRNEGLVIGAGVTLTELLESPLSATYFMGVLPTTLRQVASPLIRNMATVGGALASTHPWSDVITLFLALDARVAQYAGEVQTTPLAGLVERRGTIDRAIITEVVLPIPAKHGFVSFEKFVRTGVDVAMLNCTCRLTISGGCCDDVRIVFGGTPGIGHRIEAVESSLTGAKLDHAVIESAAELAAEVIPSRDDLRASGDYRRILAAAGVRRCLTRIAHGANGV